MALFVLLYRRAKTLDATDWQGVREESVPAAQDEPVPDEPAAPPGYPTLPTAGVRPTGKETAARV
jgi:hypothetical protein